jgi:hypothetical protein
MDLLARTILLLNEKHGAQAKAVTQVPGKVQPDGEFEWEGVKCSIEVECTTLETQPRQVIQNYTKARLAERPVLFVVSSPTAAQKLVPLLEKIPARLDEDYALFCWNGRMERYPAAPERPLFLKDKKTTEGTASRADDTAAVGKAVNVLISMGRTRVTGADVLAMLPQDVKERFLLPDTHMLSPKLGHTMRSLGMEAAKARDDRSGQVVRFYELKKVP